MIIDDDHPLDMQLSVTMFGKYSEYKTLFRDFQTSINNTNM